MSDGNNFRGLRGHSTRDGPVPQMPDIASRERREHLESFGRNRRGTFLHFGWGKEVNDCLSVAAWEYSIKYHLSTPIISLEFFFPDRLPSRFDIAGDRPRSPEICSELSELNSQSFYNTCIEPEIDFGGVSFAGYENCFMYHCALQGKLLSNFASPPTNDSQHSRVLCGVPLRPFLQLPPIAGQRLIIDLPQWRS